MLAAALQGGSAPVRVGCHPEGLRGSRSEGSTTPFTRRGRTSHARDPPRPSEWRRAPRWRRPWCRWLKIVAGSSCFSLSSSEGPWPPRMTRARLATGARRGSRPSRRHTQRRCGSCRSRPAPGPAHRLRHGALYEFVTDDESRTPVALLPAGRLRSDVARDLPDLAAERPVYALDTLEYAGLSVQTRRSSTVRTRRRGSTSPRPCSRRRMPRSPPHGHSFVAVGRQLRVLTPSGWPL